MNIKLFISTMLALYFIVSIVSAEPSSNTTAANNLPLNSSSGTFAIILVSIILLGALMLIPVLYDINQAYALEKKRMDHYFPCKESLGLSQENRLELCKQYTVNISGVNGLSRGLFASGIIVILGILLLYGAVNYGFDEKVSNLASLIAGTLSTIVGFYFGSKSTEEATSARDAASARGAASAIGAAKPSEQKNSKVIGDIATPPTEGPDGTQEGSIQKNQKLGR